MATTYADIQPLKEAGKTNAEIAAELLGRRWTVRPIPVAALTDWLRETRVNGVPVARFAPDGSWSGVLPSLVGQVDAKLSDAIEETLSHLRNTRSEQLTTSAGERGVLLHSVALAVGLSSEQRASLYALGGGERFADATEARVAEVIEGHAISTFTEDLAQRVGAAIRLAAAADGATEQSIRDAATAEVG